MPEVSPGENDSVEHMGAFKDFQSPEASPLNRVRKDGSVEFHDSMEAAREAAKEKNEEA